ncbi:MAG: hypothetical protein OJF47_000227 [Nitrospira sp.]|jgi:hypothetical protein|nr:MAG: hypothetical protein OJF47_000227 [Nitrospira sp.]
MDKEPSKHRPNTRPAEEGHRNGQYPHRRTAPVSTRRGGCSPHLSWAQAITGKFSLNANLRGRSRPSLIDLVPPARLTIRSEYFAWPSLHIHIGAVLNRLCNRHSLQLRSDRISKAQVNDGRVVRADEVMGSSRFGRFLEASSLTRRLMELLSPTDAQSEGEKPDPGRKGSKRSGTTFQRLGPSFRGNQGLRAAYGDDNTPSDLALCLTRRHRRTDMTRTDLVRAFGAGPSVLSGRAPLRVEESRVHRLGTGKPHDQSAEPAGRTAPSVPALNVSLVADEVIKHLDRRLIAARERMGRI